MKGQSTKNFWRIRAKAERDDLYYVLCFVGDEATNWFFPLSQTSLHDLLDAYRISGVKYDEQHSGFNWGAALPFRNRWSELPL